MSPARRPPVDDEALRSAKESLVARGPLLGGAPLPLWLPDEIDRSWRRSITAGVSSTSAAPRFVDAYDADSELARAARPVLDRLEGALQDMGTAIFLADRTGQIVARRVTGSSERARFDGAYAAEGFDFSEESIGTNGLGTPIQEGAAVFVRGAEHFNAALEQLACAGVGIRHPATGRLIGSLSLAAPVDAAEMLMLAMTREGAQQIVDNLSATLGRREVALGRSYQRHRAKGPVIVLNSDTVMTNVTGLSFLDVEMHARLWDALLSRDWAAGPQVLDLDLQSLQARVLAHRLDDSDDAAFAVEILDRGQQVPPARRPAGGEQVVDPFVSSLRRAAARSPGALLVTGPSGTGKLHVVRAWLEADGHARPLVLDGGELASRPTWRREAADVLAGRGAVVLRRLEDLADSEVSAVRALADGLTAVGSDARPDPDPGRPPARLVLTADLGRCSEAVHRMLAQVAVGVDVPPLASRRDEIPSIVRTVLAGIETRRRPVLSAATLQVLLRWDWPGGAAELRHLLLSLAAELPGQSISPYHLPERMWDAANRRSLSRIESAERAEILAVLRQCEGNRSQAAKLLGIGRTTLYRKLQSLGIDDEALRP